MVALPPSKRTILTMVQNACKEMSIPVPTMLVGNLDQQVVQLLALANREAREFCKEANHNDGWQQLRKEHLFQTIGFMSSGDTTLNSPIITNIPDTTGFVEGYVVVGNYIATGTQIVSIDSATQITVTTNASGTATGTGLTVGLDRYPLPDDLGYFMAATFWDRAYRWQLMGPLSAQEWQVLKSGISPVGPRRRFRIMDNLFYIDPVPGQSGNTEVFEYFSINWAQSASGTGQSEFLADTDYYLLDDDCMELGIQVRFLSAKGFDFSKALANYTKKVGEIKGENGANRNIPLNSLSYRQRFLNTNNVPDTGFGT